MSSQAGPQTRPFNFGTQADGVLDVDDSEIVPESCDADEDEDDGCPVDDPSCEGGAGDSHDACERQDTPASHLRNALQILVLAGPNWLSPLDAFAVRGRIEAALRQLEGAR